MGAQQFVIHTSCQTKLYNQIAMDTDPIIAKPVQNMEPRHGVYKVGMLMGGRGHVILRKYG